MPIELLDEGMAELEDDLLLMLVLLLAGLLLEKVVVLSRVGQYSSQVRML